MSIAIRLDSARLTEIRTPEPAAKVGGHLLLDFYCYGNGNGNSIGIGNT